MKEHFPETIFSVFVTCPVTGCRIRTMLGMDGVAARNTLLHHVVRDHPEESASEMLSAIEAAILEVASNVHLPWPVDFNKDIPINGVI